VCIAALVSIAAPAALSAPATSSSSLASLESGVLRQLNLVRAGHGLSMLRESPRLAAAATQHSREMASDGYFQHNSVDGTSFSTRISHWYALAGYHSWTVGENLLWATPTISPSRALSKWMQSPGHRANILDSRWREIGVGVVHTSSAGGTFGNRPVTIITTDFGVRR
jgi:uncharacterized protein YkwD